LIGIDLTGLLLAAALLLLDIAAHQRIGEHPRTWQRTTASLRERPAIGVLTADAAAPLATAHHRAKSLPRGRAECAGAERALRWPAQNRRHARNGLIHLVVQHALIEPRATAALSTTKATTEPATAHSTAGQATAHLLSESDGTIEQQTSCNNG
jgi:hypothetical protein